MSSIIQSGQFGFFKPDFEILAFFEHLWLSGFFSVGKTWLCQNIVWAAYSLQISSDESPSEVYRIRISGLDSGRIQHILNKPD